MEKEFECKPHCKKLFVESISFGCNNCIKKIDIKLNEKQSKAVEAFIALDDSFSNN